MNLLVDVSSKQGEARANWCVRLRLGGWIPIATFGDRYCVSAVGG